MRRLLASLASRALAHVPSSWCYRLSSDLAWYAERGTGRHIGGAIRYPRPQHFTPGVQVRAVTEPTVWPGEAPSIVGSVGVVLGCTADGAHLVRFDLPRGVVADVWFHPHGVVKA